MNTHAEISKLSLLVAAMLGDDFTFTLHDEVLHVVTKYNDLDDSDVEGDIEFVKEVISANIFIS